LLHVDHQQVPLASTRSHESASEEQGRYQRKWYSIRLLTFSLGSLRSQSFNEEEQKLFRLYGKLPNKKDLLQNKLKVGPSLPNISYIDTSN